MNAIKSSQAISLINAELKTNVSDTLSVSIIRVNRLIALGDFIELCIILEYILSSKLGFRLFIFYPIHYSLPYYPSIRKSEKNHENLRISGVLRRFEFVPPEYKSAKLPQLAWS
jgi:hypothetical protein